MFHVFSPFSAYFIPYNNVVEKSLLKSHDKFSDHTHFETS